MNQRMRPLDSSRNEPAFNRSLGAKWPPHLMAPDAVFANHRGQKRRVYADVANREASLEVEI